MKPRTSVAKNQAQDEYESIEAAIREYENSNYQPHGFDTRVNETLEDVTMVT